MESTKGLDGVPLRRSAASTECRFDGVPLRRSAASKKCNRRTLRALMMMKAVPDFVLVGPTSAAPLVAIANRLACISLPSTPFHSLPISSATVRGSTIILPRNVDCEVIFSTPSAPSPSPSSSSPAPSSPAPPPLPHLVQYRQCVSSSPYPLWLQHTAHLTLPITSPPQSPLPTALITSTPPSLPTLHRYLTSTSPRALPPVSLPFLRRIISLGAAIAPTPLPLATPDRCDPPTTAIAATSSDAAVLVKLLSGDGGGDGGDDGGGGGGGGDGWCIGGCSGRCGGSCVGLWVLALLSVAPNTAAAAEMFELRLLPHTSSFSVPSTIPPPPPAPSELQLPAEAAESNSTPPPPQRQQQQQKRQRRQRREKQQRQQREGDSAYQQLMLREIAPDVLRGWEAAWGVFSSLALAPVADAMRNGSDRSLHVEGVERIAAAAAAGDCPLRWVVGVGSVGAALRRTAAAITAAVHIHTTATVSTLRRLVSIRSLRRTPEEYEAVVAAVECVGSNGLDDGDDGDDDDGRGGSGGAVDEEWNGGCVRGGGSGGGGGRGAEREGSGFYVVREFEGVGAVATALPVILTSPPPTAAAGAISSASSPSSPSGASFAAAVPPTAAATAIAATTAATITAEPPVAITPTTATVTSADWAARYGLVYAAAASDDLATGDGCVAFGRRRWRAGGGGLSLVLCGHLDVVPVESRDVDGFWADAAQRGRGAGSGAAAGEAGDPICGGGGVGGGAAAGCGWSSDPWVLREARTRRFDAGGGDGRGDDDVVRLVGRGAGDMKGGVVSVITATWALQHLGLHPVGRFEVHFVVAEEYSGAGARRLLRSLHAAAPTQSRAAACIIPEPLGPTTAQPGVFWCEYQVAAAGAHVLDPTRAPNAILAAVRIYSSVAAALTTSWNALTPSGPRLSFSLGQLRGGAWPSSVPAACTAAFRGSFPIAMAPAAARAAVAAAIVAAAAVEGVTLAYVAWPGFLAPGCVHDCGVAAAVLPEPAADEVDVAAGAVAATTTGDAPSTGSGIGRAKGVAAAPRSEDALFSPLAEAITDTVLSRGGGAGVLDVLEIAMSDADAGVTGGSGGERSGGPSVGGLALRPRAPLTCTTDVRAYEEVGVPATCFGPEALAIHGTDESVTLDGVRDVAAVLAVFITRWCGTVCV